VTDFFALNQEIRNSGMTMSSIAKKSGISRPTLYNRLRGIGEFSAPEIEGLCKALHLSKSDRERIFFAKNVAKTAQL
jgi:DNA-binding phage protein